MRIGQGYDVHRLTEGRPLILGGVKIPCEQGLLGHSDADVLLHAVMDALLGAAALGDIGQHFPDNDSKYQDISSLLLLQKVAGILQRSAWRTLNLDSTVVAEAPRLAAYIPEMRENIAKTLGIGPEQVNVKATTAEGLGIEGRQEGISAHAVVLIGKIPE